MGKTRRHRKRSMKRSMRRSIKKGGGWFGNLVRKKPSILTSNNQKRQEFNQQYNLNIPKEINDASAYFYKTMGNNINYNAMNKKNPKIIPQTVKSIMNDYFKLYKPNLPNKQRQSIINSLKYRISTNNSRSRSSSRTSDPGSVDSNFTGINNDELVPVVENLPKITSTTLFPGPRIPAPSFAKKTFAPTATRVVRVNAPKMETARILQTRRNRNKKPLQIANPKLSLQENTVPNYWKNIKLKHFLVWLLL